MDVLVTGASGGIGRAVSELFLERGHRVNGIDVAPATVEHANYRHHVVDVRDHVITTMITHTFHHSAGAG